MNANITDYARSLDAASEARREARARAQQRLAAAKAARAKKPARAPEWWGVWFDGRRPTMTKKGEVRGFLASDLQTRAPADWAAWRGGRAAAEALAAKLGGVAVQF